MDGIEAGKGRLMLKRRPDGGGADQLGGDQRDLTKPTLNRPLLDELTAYRALRLMHGFALRPELATSLAALAFGGAV